MYARPIFCLLSMNFLTFDAPINVSFNNQQKKTPNTQQFIVLLLLIPKKNTPKKLGFHHLAGGGATEYTNHRFSQYRDSWSKYLGLNLCKSVFIRTQSPIQSPSSRKTDSLSLSLSQSDSTSLSNGLGLSLSNRRPPLSLKSNSASLPFPQILYFDLRLGFDLF